MAIQTPAFRNKTVGPLDKADPAFAVVVTVGGHRVNFVAMTPSQAPDVGERHQMGLNAATPLIDNPTTDTMTTMLPLPIQLSDRLGLTSEFRVSTIYLKAGKDNTTFDVVAVI